MKKIIFLSSILTSMSSIACPDISAKYLCPELAEEALGTRVVVVRKSSLAYSLRLDNELYEFKIGSWNRNVNHSAETKAECEEKSVALKTRGQIIIGENTFNISGSIDMTPTIDGVDVSLKTQDEEIYRFECARLRETRSID